MMRRQLPLKARAGRSFLAAIDAYRTGDPAAAYRALNGLSRPDLELGAVWFLGFFAHSLDFTPELVLLVEQMRTAIDSHGDAWEQHFYQQEI